MKIHFCLTNLNSTEAGRFVESPTELEHIPQIGHEVMILQITYKVYRVVFDVGVKQL